MPLFNLLPQGEQGEYVIMRPLKGEDLTRWKVYAHHLWPCLSHIKQQLATFCFLHCSTYISEANVPSHPASPSVHITLKTPAAPPSPSLHPSSAGKHGKQAQQPEWDTHAEEKISQEVVEECLAQGVMVTRAKRLRGQE
ncbi:hypothetical protein BKA70DRAFT_678132 [Coprinopsis sp. MPI-PUGE-AT-0042]|nr:hypothetical protein BKA70DRAFT_678132 [Coprinopsis sp. MPI-PUGE-AT-0042]